MENVTLRDLFATVALAGLLSDQRPDGDSWTDAVLHTSFVEPSEDEAANLARAAFILADRMLEEHQRIEHGDEE